MSYRIFSCTISPASGFGPAKSHLWRYRPGETAARAFADFLPDHKRNQYDLSEIRKWLELFLYRFFQISQFKRTAVPNGPKVGSGGSLSPRGDWRAPSDSSATAWLSELRRNLPD